MKLFETPELEVIKFAVTDMITTSAGLEEGEEDPPSPPGLGNCIG